MEGDLPIFCEWCGGHIPSRELSVEIEEGIWDKSVHISCLECVVSRSCTTCNVVYPAGMLAYQSGCCYVCVSFQNDLEAQDRREHAERH